MYNLQLLGKASTLGGYIKSRLCDLLTRTRSPYLSGVMPPSQCLTHGSGRIRLAYLCDAHGPEPYAHEFPGTAGSTPAPVAITMNSQVSELLSSSPS